jgi:hypothetical protein
MAMLSNWPRLLHDYIDSRRNMPFSWGRNDCCTFAADAMLAITGHDPMKELRGYKLAKDAMRISGGKKQLFAFAGATMINQGFQAIPLAFATFGDVVGVVLRGRQTLGMHLGNTIASPGKNGIVFIESSEVAQAWRAE